MPRRSRSAVAFVLLLAVGQASARRHKVPPRAEPVHEPTPMDADLAEFDRDLYQMRQTFMRREAPQPRDPVWVGRVITFLFALEYRFQLLHGKIACAKADDRARLHPAYLSRLHTLRVVQLATLQGLIAIHGWITISQFGSEVEQGAARLLVESDDVSFQQKMLPLLRSLAIQHETTVNVAALEQRVAARLRRCPAGAPASCADADVIEPEAMYSGLDENAYDECGRPRRHIVPHR